MADPWLVLAAAGIEGLIGYPAALHRRLPHPVTWLGAVIAWTERRWNDPARAFATRRALGVFALLMVVGMAVLAGWAIEHVSRSAPPLIFLTIIAASFGLAGRSLYDHVHAVEAALSGGDITAARTAVAKVVGRDVEALDQHGVASAALETLAESFNDGLIAPLFWFLAAGLPGLFAYKAVNTADSMIGHMEPRWRAFGWAAARIDDLMNLIPARIAGLLLCIVGGRGWAVMLRDARKHASPNSGWPEAAMAGALRLRLGGSARYDGVLHPRPQFGDGCAPDVADLRRGLRLYLRACALLAGGLALGGLAWPR